MCFPDERHFRINGRIFIAFVFIYEALDALVFFQKTKATMTVYGLTWNQDLVLTTLISILILGGIMVLIGYYSGIGSFLLLLYWLPYTLIVYSFWNDPVELQRLHALYFMRNLALCGGLMLLLANGAGKYSIKRLLFIMKLPK
ncbi:MAG: DoxX family protein [Saprospiraceae bacterium]|nr:DoxX family protein [Saprospiraceae bacterium]